MQQDSKYIPSLRFDFLTPFYDPLQKLCFPETKAKINLIRQSKIKPGSRVLDIGCGTATLTILLKKNSPDATVVGLDSDPKVLEIAKKKAVNANVDIQFENGFSDNLPFDDELFDVVFSNLMFHHLDRQKRLKR